MGFFWEGLPPYVLPWASGVLGPHAMAIETGTFRGDTSLLLRRHFGECRTIERSANLAEAARLRFAGDSAITISEGSSRDLLPDVLPDPTIPCFLWLDAHGIYDHVGSDQEENPLLAELEIVVANRIKAPTIIAIDDARGMGTQPDWPSVGSIARLLEAANYVVASFDDILIGVRSHHRPDLYALYQSSRMVEAGSVFQVWQQLMRSVKIRSRMDRLLGTFTRK